MKLWLNFTGRARITQRGGAVELPPNSFAVFAGNLRQVRLDEKRHEFILVRFTTAFLLEHSRVALKICCVTSRTNPSAKSTRRSARARTPHRSPSLAV